MPHITKKEIGGTVYIVESITPDKDAKKVILDKVKDLIFTNAKIIKTDTKYRAK